MGGLERFGSRMSWKGGGLHHQLNNSIEIGGYIDEIFNRDVEENFYQLENRLRREVL